MEDRRGQRMRRIPRIPMGGLGRGMPRGIRLSGGTVVVLLIIMFLTGRNPLQMLGMLAGGGGGGGMMQQSPSGPPPQGDEQAQFVSVVLGYLEDTWAPLLQEHGMQYQPAKLVLFTDEVHSACGYSSAATGPFYCPGDGNVYIDLGFFRELHRLGAPGDFAQAYVLAHEIGHHVQNLMGTTGWVRRMQRQVSRADANRLSVLLELQADCFAGIWAHHVNQREQVLEPGDVEEGLRAAASIGDDRLQRRAGRAVQPESFTHGTSDQRVQWLRTGMETGRLEDCDCFEQAGLRSTIN